MARLQCLGVEGDDLVLLGSSNLIVEVEKEQPSRREGKAVDAFVRKIVQLVIRDLGSGVSE